MRRQVVLRRDPEEDVGVGLCGIAVQRRDLAACREESRARAPLKIGVAYAPGDSELARKLLRERWRGRPD
jgi:hypothetical protein